MTATAPSTASRPAPSRPGLWGVGVTALALLLALPVPAGEPLQDGARGAEV